MTKLIATIGIETHVQLDTKSKLFCTCDNNAREAAPNSFQLLPDFPIPAPPPPVATVKPKPVVRDRTPPRTRILARPRAVLTTNKARARAVFRFASSERGSSFRCKLDRKPYRACVSPRAYLLKPGRHTAEEWEIMKTHARLGADAIEQAERDAEWPVKFLAFAKQIAHYHHEKWDGSGYPDGLAGDAIPIPARLMAIADVFDALISRRPYKEAFPLNTARTLIAAGRGQHFDPDITDAFLAGIDDFAAIAARYADDVAEAPVVAPAAVPAAS